MCQCVQERVERQRGWEQGVLQLVADMGLAWVGCWKWRRKWPGRDEGEGNVCKETPHWVLLPLPLTGCESLGKFPTLSGPLSHL